MSNFFWASLIVDVMFQGILFVFKPELDMPFIPVFYRLIFGFESRYLTGTDMVGHAGEVISYAQHTTRPLIVPYS